MPKASGSKATLSSAMTNIEKKSAPDVWQRVRHLSNVLLAYSAYKASGVDLDDPRVALKYDTTSEILSCPCCCKAFKVEPKAATIARVVYSHLSSVLHILHVSMVFGIPESKIEEHFPFQCGACKKKYLHKSYFKTHTAVCRKGQVLQQIQGSLNRPRSFYHDSTDIDEPFPQSSPSPSPDPACLPRQDCMASPHPALYSAFDAPSPSTSRQSSPDLPQHGRNTTADDCPTSKHSHPIQEEPLQHTPILGEDSPIAECSSVPVYVVRTPQGDVIAYVYPCQPSATLPSSIPSSLSRPPPPPPPSPADLETVSRDTLDFMRVDVTHANSCDSSAREH